MTTRYFWARETPESAWSIVSRDIAANWVDVMGGKETLSDDEVAEWGPEIERPAHLVDPPEPPSPPWIAPDLLRAINDAGFRALSPCGLPITLVPLDPADPNLVMCDTMEDLAFWLGLIGEAGP